MLRPVITYFPLTVLLFAVLVAAPSARAHTADLSVDVTSNPSTVGVSKSLTYRFGVNNAGPDDALGVILTVTLPSSVTFNSATANGWRCTRSGVKVNCSIDLLPIGNPAATITVAVMSPSTPQRIRVEAQIDGIASIEPNSYNNTGFAVTDVVGASSCTDQKPAHTAPAASATNVSNPARFSWSAVAGASLYRLWLSQNGGAPKIVAETASTEALVPLSGEVGEWFVEAVVPNCSPSRSDSTRFAISVSEPIPIYTLAGTPSSPGLVDGDLSGSRFHSPGGLAIDSSGNLFIADSENHVIRVISEGKVRTFAGLAGQPGGADGSGIAARFRAPAGLTIDRNNNLYLADRGNHTIRKVTPAGEVTTIAGLANGAGHADGSGSAARFFSPDGIAIDASGNLYVADSMNHVIRKLTATGDTYTVSTIAGQPGVSGSSDGPSTSATFNRPAGVAVDLASNVLVADSANHLIRKVTTETNVVTTIAGRAGTPGDDDGFFENASFNDPRGIVVGSTGAVYVADSGNHTIRMLRITGVTATVAGRAGLSGTSDGSGESARFQQPTALVFAANGTLYVSDTGNHTVRSTRSLDVGRRRPIRK